MPEGEPHLTLDQLNLATQAWITQEYQRTVNREIGVTPLERYLAGPNVARECPGSEATEALYLSPKIENFCWRIEQAHLREGGWR